MGLEDAKRLLQWNVVKEALVDAGVDADVIALVEHARSVDEVVHSVAIALIGSSDKKQVKNYVKLEMVGMSATFERAYVELVRPGGKTSHELRELLRDRLTHIRHMLTEKMTPGLVDGLIQGINDDLALEAP